MNEIIKSIYLSKFEYGVIENTNDGFVLTNKLVNFVCDTAYIKKEYKMSYKKLKITDIFIKMEKRGNEC